MTKIPEFIRENGQWAFLIAILSVTTMLVATGSLQNYQIGIVISALYFALFAMSFNLLFGYTGLLSFGHAAFFGGAGYLFTFVMRGNSILPESTQSLLPALLIALVGVTLLAFVIGALSVRLGGLFFAMLTLAFSMFIYQVVFQFRSITGGSDGLIVPVDSIDLGIFVLNLSNTQHFYYFTVILFLLPVIVLWRIVNSPYGEMLKAIRENPERAEFIGLPVRWFQLSSFVVSGIFSGVAGVLYAMRSVVISPGVLNWSMSAEPVLMTLLGGPGYFIGPIVGAIGFVILEQLLTTFTNHWHIGLGLLLIPIVILLPGGVMSLIPSTEGDNMVINKLTKSPEEATEQNRSENSDN